MVLKSLDLPHANSVLIELLQGDVLKTRLQTIVKNLYSLNTVLKGLKEDNLIAIQTQPYGKNIQYISLTEKGRQVATNLLKLEQPSQSPVAQEEKAEKLDLELTDEEVEKTKHLNLLYHVNVMDDHVTVEEILPGKPSRIFNIYIKQNGGGNFRLWCEYDDSYDCWHVKAAWTYPQVQKMMTQYKGKVKVCQTCGFENPERAKFCMECGTKLE